MICIGVYKYIKQKYCATNRVLYYPQPKTNMEVLTRGLSAPDLPIAARGPGLTHTGQNCCLRSRLIFHLCSPWATDRRSGLPRGLFSFVLDHVAKGWSYMLAQLPWTNIAACTEFEIGDAHISLTCSQHRTHSHFSHLSPHTSLSSHNKAPSCKQTRYYFLVSPWYFFTVSFD